VTCAQPGSCRYLPPAGRQVAGHLLRVRMDVAWLPASRHLIPGNGWVDRPPSTPRHA
jgi:hypothetical protein